MPKPRRSPAALRVTRLRCEYQVNPLGLDERQPRLSWELVCPRRGCRQIAYRIECATSESALGAGRADRWDSGRVESAESIQVPFNGPAPESRERLWWCVTVWDEAGAEATSAPAWFELGLLEASDWTAEWIGSAVVGGPRTSPPVPYLRREFAVADKPIARARLYATALGLYEFSLNGTVVGDLVFAPGWTDYHHRLQYHTYDVAALLRPGTNCAGALLGDGWYCGHVGWNDRQHYGDRPRFCAQLEIDYADGTRDTLTTDGSWRTTTGPILSADMLQGETYDARLELGPWDQPGYDDSAWQPVVRFAPPAVPLVAPCGPPVRRLHEFAPVGPPVAHGHGRHRRLTFDLGQNLVGRVRLRVEAPAGTTLVLRHAEMLQPDGTIYTENLRSARCTDVYTCRGGGVETWEPRFTFHGFRYVELAGLPGEPRPDAVTGIVLHSDTPATGRFQCSDPLLNQLQHNIDWGQRGNFLEVPTDCPQRDERLGWTGDAQVFIRTAAFNRDVAAFFTKWQNDLRDAQGPGGTIPPVAPAVDNVRGDGGPAWADAVVICPWTVYQVYGDTRLLERHYDSLVAFLGACEAASLDSIREHPDHRPWGGFGDWLALDGSGKTEGGTPKDLIGTAFYAHCAGLLARIARLLGREPDARRHERTAARVRRAFQRRYVTPDGLVAGGTQTAYVLALHFDLVPTALRPALVRELVRDIERRGGKLSTGFVGSPYLPWVLSENGRLDVATKLLFQREWPSWLYAVTQGATTIWERWDGWTHDKGFQTPAMNSFNHYAYGAIGAWLYAVVAGLDLDPAAPAYRRVRVRPHPIDGLTHARAELHTMYGPAASGWKRLRGGVLQVDATVPANATAEIRVPAPPGATVREGDRPAERAEGLALVERSETHAVFAATSGTYRFTVAPAP
jgi:alpha-L-rhamnosidase